MSERMEKLMNSLYIDRVPDSWARVAYPSLKPLGLWFMGALHSAIERERERERKRERQRG
jgi:hypothetical protein